MADSLDTYRKKRDRKSTPEPAGDPTAADLSANRFVIQEHSATRLHWDLRLERDGVLLSWALPRGLPLDPDENHLAVHTEDHPLEYLEFAGEIPKGNYGAGTMGIWDHGVYEAHEFEPRKLVITLHGERVDTRYALFQAGKGDRNWLIHRMDPAPEGYEPMPEELEPMLARPARLPRSEDRWGYEIGWAGVRVLAFSAPGRLRLHHPRLGDVTDRFPEIRRLNRQLGSTAAILDGVIVAFGDDGRPDPGPAKARLARATAPRASAAGRDGISLQLFDLLYLEIGSLLDSPYIERRDSLAQLALGGDAWQTPGFHRGEGAELRERSAAFGLEGIVAKRLDSRYEPGVVSDNWRRIKSR
jgi:bifunctional non-homologous end joining protein LigD